MNTKELRIENLVIYKVTDSVCKIRGIGEGVVWLNGTENGGPISSDNFEPIPLTQEIISKCSLYYLHLKKRKFCDFFDVYDNEHLICSVKYVHELQNLHAAINKKELKINL